MTVFFEMKIIQFLLLTYYLQVKHAVTLVIDNVDKWIMSEQEKEEQLENAQGDNASSPRSGASGSTGIERLYS